jgi:acyl-CoA hydrolase
VPKLLKSGDVASLLRPGSKVFVQGASSEPSALIQDLLRAPEACAGVEFVSCQIPGLNRLDFAGLHQDARSTGLFVTPEMHSSYRAGKVRFMPLAYSDMNRYLASMSIDVALIQVTPTAKRGMFSLGTSAHFVPAVLANATTVVAEINEDLPPVGKSVQLDEDRLDYVLPTAHALLTHDAGVPSETIQRIGRHVATLVRDGDHIQFGIGKVPGAILNALGSHRGLVCHGGLIGDPVINLHEAGALDPTNPMTCTSVIGTEHLYNWVRDRTDIHIHPVAYTHNVRVMAELERFTAINSVLSVNLHGLANAETVNGRQVGGCGGLPDFVRGARLSKGGRSILALPSTAGQGKISRIVSSFGTEIPSVTRTDVDYVVTEHGVADLGRKSLLERAEALIAIAAPHFRDQLSRDWEQQLG